MINWDSAFGKNDIRGIYGKDVTEELFNYSIDPSTKNLVNLVIKVGNNDSISYNNKIVVNEDSAKKALALINKHTTHKIPASLSDKIYKNATSSRIAQIIVDLKKFGFSINEALSILNKFGENSITIVKEDIYKFL